MIFCASEKVFFHLAIQLVYQGRILFSSLSQLYMRSKGSYCGDPIGGLVFFTFSQL